MIDQLVFWENPWQIRTWPGDPSLRLVAHAVTDFDAPDAPADRQELRDLIEHMGTVMVENGGAGLAAPQVGVRRRVIVLADDRPQKKGRVSCFALVNPRVVSASEEEAEEDEGCLSLPGLRVAVDRPVTIRVEHEDVYGETMLVDTFGEEARVIQHEIDHLDGKLILDYLDPAERREAVLVLAMMAERNRVETYALQKEMYARLSAAVAPSG